MADQVLDSMRVKIEGIVDTLRKLQTSMDVLPSCQLKTQLSQKELRLLALYERDCDEYRRLTGLDYFCPGVACNECDLFRNKDCMGRNWG